MELKIKENFIKEETKRIKNMFKTKKYKELCHDLIKNLVYLSISLEEIKQQLNTEGFTEYYINGENQSGIKAHPASNIYISLTKSYNSTLKMINEFIEKEKKEDGDTVDELADFLNAK